jgi:multidrug resistance efflux pump
VVHRVLIALRFYRLVWHPILFDTAVFTIIWALITLTPLNRMLPQGFAMTALSPATNRYVRTGITGVMVLAACVGAYMLWWHYEADPWTRDGRVRAEVVQVAPDVPGLVTKVLVNHDRFVHRGDVLFEIDRARYDLALEESETAIQRAEASQASAKAAIERATANLAEYRREAKRNRGLGELVATETTQQSETKVAEGEAALAEAKASLAQADAQRATAISARDLARLNLTRTRVLAPIDGQLSISRCARAIMWPRQTRAGAGGQRLAARGRLF